MMVTFVSQCDKKAIARSRRVLDAFADRIGDNTWQTVITQEGLLAVKKLLRKTATKNTAVSCHWIRNRARSELIWVVGNRTKFNELGRVPVNSTVNDLLHSDWENQWHHAYSIQVLAALAALLHDLGKATVGFQKKLHAKFGVNKGDPYRHEWISLHIFLAMINGCGDDEAWLKRLVNFSSYIAGTPDWLSSLGEEKEKPRLESAPPLAKLLGWLIVTHHRLPFYDENYFSPENRKALRANTFLLDNTITDFYEQLKAVDYWVKNPKSIEGRSDNADFWQLKAPIVNSNVWQTALARWANKALNHAPLIQLAEKPISEPFIMHLARLCLMIGDHNFSSLSLEQSQQVKGDKALKDELLANTDRKTGLPKQALDQHLLGVARFSAQFARMLPQLALHLPPIDKLKAKAFNQRTSASRFQWQNRSFDLATKLQATTQKQGFFGVNMASTGCGKTLANARIMHALADPKRGTRFTIALGLRVLTLQTGLALRKRLDLDESNLAILVGSAASRKLFELNNQSADEDADEFASVGSESLAELVDETVKFGDSGIDSSILGTVIENPKARDLLFAPVVSCTIDHIINASENIRGGKHIAPILRLLSSDLILDEPDDFGQSDLPALSRLVHLAGMFGSRVLLSSATLTPDLTAGLFAAYQAGRDIWNAQTGLVKSKVVCAWFDENGQSHSECSQADQFIAQQGEFVTKRAAKLAKEPPRRIGEILPINLPPPVEENDRINFGALAELLLAEANNLHHQYHNIDKSTEKTASVGLIRCANIAPMVRIAQELYQFSETLEDTEVHLCCYHARQLLVLRNSLETKLDRILDRSNAANLFDHWR
ncbi:type I-F CRISPR-associated helicase Cas3f [Zhongshania guokunii]|uniref:Type I-F CRISPR-associated helicase Cas3f n=1 Tax=Zhongshania guokunii TaxID=641783 RepID=A0ABV3U821_9GAMM